MRALSSLKALGGRGGAGGDYKSKIVVALKDIELERRELEGLKGRLAERRQKLFDSTVRSLETKDKSKARVYANEHIELCKVIRVVEASELALIQVSLRLQSITEIGDAMAHLSSAFRSLKTVSKTMEGFGPTLDATSSSINDTLTETMASMGQLTPSINVDIQHNENAEALVEQARRFAEERAQQLKDTLQVMPSQFEEQIHAVDDHIPVLAAGEEGDDESPILGTLFTSTSAARVEGEVLNYAITHNGVVDVSETSATLGIPEDEVEQSMIRLMAQGKVKSQKRSE